MGRGKNVICCCESSCWCCTIEIIYLVIGIIRIIIGTSALSSCTSKKITSSHDDVFCTAGEYSTQSALNELLSGIVDLVFCALIYCGIKNKNRCMLNIYIGIQIAVVILIMILPIIAFIDFLATATETGDKVNSKVITAAVLAILLAILLNILWPLFCIYVVSVHRNEICNGNTGFNQSAYTTGFARPSAHSGANADSVPMSDPTPSLGADPDTKNGDSAA